MSSAIRPKVFTLWIKTRRTNRVIIYHITKRDSENHLDLDARMQEK